MMPKDRESIAIIGGGVGGLVTALSLSRYNLSFSIFEARPEFYFNGAGLGLGPNAVKILKSLDIDPVGDCGGHQIERFDVCSLNGEKIRSIGDGKYLPVGISRENLIAALRSRVSRDKIVYDMPLVGAEDCSDSVEIAFRNGSREKCSLLIGADGINSTVKKITSKELLLRKKEFVTWAAVVPFEFPSGYSVHYWGVGSRFGITNVGNGDVYWWGMKNRSSASSNLIFTIDEVLKEFNGWPKVVLDVINSTAETQLCTFFPTDRDFSEDWGCGRITTVGDAAHPMLPSLGQGAGAAIEDGVVLARCLNKFGETETALRQYEKLRYDRVRYLVNPSRRLSRIEQSSLACVSNARKLMLKLTPNCFFNRVLHRVNDFYFPDELQGIVNAKK